mmetsp:Transcript_48946/g.106654  ORF Transcript_48946/g.106654 Transcript_48946/m.106654 type:complete len:133 (+) Transcript_48946:31-429(+)
MFRSAALVARSSSMAASRRSPLVQQQRQMGGGHGKVEYTGIEASVRKVFPEDHQIVLANFGAFLGIYALYKITSIGGGKPAEAAPAPAAPAASSSDSEVPSIFDESFEEWAKVPGNLEKYEKSVEDWANSQK